MLLNFILRKCFVTYAEDIEVRTKLQAFIPFLTFSYKKTLNCLLQNPGASISPELKTPKIHKKENDFKIINNS